MTEYSGCGVSEYPNSLLCFDMELSSQNLWIPNYSHYQHFLFETITELRNKKMNDVQIANWLNDNGHKTPRGIPLEITMFILLQRKEKED